MHKKPNLKDTLSEVSKWSLELQYKFLERIGESVPIGVRIIIERNELSDSQKVEALRLLSEFHHEINKIKKSIFSASESKLDITEIADYVKFASNYKEKLISNEIAFCMKDAFMIMNR